MKLLLVITLFCLVACNNADKTEKKEDINLAGAWKMLSQHYKDSTTDTTETDIQQLKIYTDSHMMYAHVSPSDSIGGFGIGTYTASGDSITEHVFYSAGDSAKDDTTRTYQLVITKSDKGYKQVITDMGNNQHIALTEDYENAGSATKTPLDGAWELTRAISIKGKDTTVENYKQYKVYYAGQVIWGHTYSDPMHKSHAGIGFGKFEMNGNKVKESIGPCTYAAARNQSFDLDVNMNGADGFTQTIVEKDGTKGIETYQRLK